MSPDIVSRLPMPDSGPADASRYAAMLACRRLEEAAAELYGLGATDGDVLLSIGQEAAAVGLSRALGERDALFVGRRRLAHASAAGVPPELILSSLSGGGDALATPRFDASDSVSALWRALGWTAARQSASGRALAVIDDLDAESGATLDALAYARARGLAVALAIEDARRESPALRLPDLEAREVDGLDVFAVERAARDLLARVAADGVCGALILRVGRHRGFSMADPDRRKERGEDRRPRGREDGLNRERARLAEQGLDDDELEAIEDAARAATANAMIARDSAMTARAAARREGAR